MATPTTPDLEINVSEKVPSAETVLYTRRDTPSFIDQDADFKPSIATIERVAAAKATIELSYRELLFNPSPRELRLQAFKRELVWRTCARERREALQAWYKQETQHLRQHRALKTSTDARCQQDFAAIDGFNIVRVLGQGSFGVVRLVSPTRELSTSMDGSPEPSFNGEVRNENIVNTLDRSQLYALKVIRKPGMLLNCQEGHVRAERDFLAQAELVRSPWIVSLYSAFQDSMCLYLVMEFMVGGDFLGVLLREDVLDEAVAR